MLLWVRQAAAPKRLLSPNDRHLGDKINLWDPDSRWHQKMRSELSAFDAWWLLLEGQLRKASMLQLMDVTPNIAKRTAKSITTVLEFRCVAPPILSPECTPLKRSESSESLKAKSEAATSKSAPAGVQIVQSVTPGTFAIR